MPLLHTPSDSVRSVPSLRFMSMCSEKAIQASLVASSVGAVKQNVLTASQSWLWMASPISRAVIYMCSMVSSFFAFHSGAPCSATRVEQALRQGEELTVGW